MKNPLFYVVAATVVALGSGWVFNCEDTTNCGKCPSVVGCTKIAKCGCCDICMENRLEGTICIPSIILSTLTDRECEVGLMCDPDTSRCAPEYDVLKKLTNKTLPSTDVLYLPSVPNAVSCNDSVCSCANNGVTIEGYESQHLSEVTSSSCSCALKKDEIYKTGRLGVILICNKKGGFEQTQCRGSVCFCVNEHGEELLGSKRFPIGQYTENAC